MRPRNDKPLDSSAEASPPPFGELPVWRCQAVGVLVVDDDRQVQTLVQLILEHNGFDVWLASTGWEAIPLYREQRKNIDVVPLDVCMNELDEPQTLEGLRAIDPEIRAGFMSRDISFDTPEELTQRGAEFFIAKPFHAHELVIPVRQLTQDGPCPFASPGGESLGDSVEK